ncbi:MAG: hypothetical protein WC348_04785 [Patescibacteria group bacterium]|jgi:hypothetical protein
MTLRQYLVLMTISAIFCWVIWVSVLYLIDPTQAGFLGFTFFYLSLFLSIVGTMSVLGLILRMKLGKEELVFKTVTTSFRQATLLGLLVIGGLILKSQRILTWWNILFLLLALIVIEFFFISYAKKR